MATLPGLPSLPVIGTVDAVQSADKAAQNVESKVVDAGKAAADIATGGTLSWITGGQGIMVLLGLLLIAAGIFSFDKTRELVISGGKTVAAAAATV